MGALGPSFILGGRFSFDLSLLHYRATELAALYMPITPFLKCENFDSKTARLLSVVPRRTFRPGVGYEATRRDDGLVACRVGLAIWPARPLRADLIGAI